MDEITEYKELLRDWEHILAFLGVVLLALIMMLCLYAGSPVYYQYQMMMTATIFIGAILTLMFLSWLRCDELRDKIRTLERGED